MSNTCRIQRYSDTPPDLPQVGFFYEGNLWRDGDEIHLLADHRLKYGKGRLPVHLYRLASSVKRMIGEGVKSVWVNAEIGLIDLTRANGVQVRKEMGVLRHLYDIKSEVERAGLRVLGFYGMMWPNPMQPELSDYDHRARYALMGSPGNASIKLTLCDDINVWQRRHGPQIERVAQYTTANNCRATAFISPFDDGMPTIEVWTETCKALRTVCDHYGLDSCMWSDGGVDRAPYSKVEPFVQVYLETMEGNK
jgi:hypothetical protein